MNIFKKIFLNSTMTKQHLFNDPAHSLSYSLEVLIVSYLREIKTNLFAVEIDSDVVMAQKQAQLDA